MSQPSPDSDIVTDKFAVLALTFDYVLLQPFQSDVVPSAVDTSSRVSKRVDVRVPLLSSAARMPLPGATIACAVSASVSMLMSGTGPWGKGGGV